jgi:hypothetical protein
VIKWIVYSAYILFLFHWNNARNSGHNEGFLQLPTCNFSQSPFNVFHKTKHSVELSYLLLASWTTLSELKIVFKAFCSVHFYGQPFFLYYKSQKISNKFVIHCTENRRNCKIVIIFCIAWSNWAVAHFTLSSNCYAQQEFDNYVT